MELINTQGSSSPKIDSVPVQPPQPQSKAKKRLHRNCSSSRYTFVIVAIGLVDFLTKRLVELLLVPNTPIGRNAIVDIMYFQNQGIAFSIPVPHFLSIIFSLILLGYFGWHVVHGAFQPRAVASICVLVGALSNFFDRIVHGHVTDYILLFGRSAINIADILVVLGILFFIRYNTNTIK